MALTKFQTDVENISALGDTPNEDDGLSADELKAKFDKAAVDIKNYINNSLCTQIDGQFTKTSLKAFTFTFSSGSTSQGFSNASLKSTSSSVVICSPADADASKWNDCNIRCTSVGTNSLTFTADTAPSADVEIHILVAG